MDNRERLSSEELVALLQQRRFKSLRQIFRTSEIANISEAFRDLSVQHCIALFRLVPRLRRSELFSYLPFERQEELLEELPEIVVLSIINDMEPVDRTRLLEELPTDISSKLIARLDPEERLIARQLLSYPEDSVGRIMSPEFLKIPTGRSVQDALQDIRWNGVQFRENLLHNIFVVDHNQRLIGHITLAALVMADPPTQMVDELMDTTQESLLASADEGQAVDYFRRYDRPYIPIVDADQKLVGVVESDDIFDVAEEEATEDIQAFGGQSSLEDSYFQTPFLTLLRKRGGWLSVIFMMSMFTANALEYFEGTIEKMSFLVFFLPLIISSGGNSGSQAASLIIRGLAVKEMELRDWGRVLGRESLIGLGLGSMLGLLGFWRVFWVSELGASAGVTVAISLIGVVLFGAIAGSMLPFLLKSLKLDPAVSSSPVISSLVDIFGIIMLFQLALLLGRVLMGQ